MVIANCHKDPKKKAFTVKDFMPKKKDKKMSVRKKTADEMLTMFRMWNAALGGKEKKHGD